MAVLVGWVLKNVGVLRAFSGLFLVHLLSRVGWGNFENLRQNETVVKKGD